MGEMSESFSMEGGEGIKTETILTNFHNFWRTFGFGCSRTYIRHRKVFRRFHTCEMLCLSLLCLFSLWIVAEGSSHPSSKCFVDDPHTGVIPDISQIGAFTKQDKVYSIRTCARRCCRTPDCDLAFFGMRTCFLVDCSFSSTVCQPREGDDDMFIALVVRNDTLGSLADTSDPPYQQRSYSRHKVNRRGYDPWKEPEVKDRITSRHIMQPSLQSKTNSVEGPQDPQSEGVSSKQGEPSSAIATTKAPKDEPASKQVTVEIQEKEGATSVPAVATTKALPVGTKAVSKTTSSGAVVTTVQPTGGNRGDVKNQSVVTLSVSGGENRVLQLPGDHQVTLHTTVDPEDDGTYTYDWRMVEGPEDSTANIIRNGEEMTVTDLQEGLYTFEIQVTSPNGAGAGRVNITVLPPPRQNTPPVAVVPKESFEMFEHTKSFLDATESTDDTGDLTYLWEVVTSPAEEDIGNGHEPLFQLQNLSPGFYQFRLTVTDIDGASDTKLVNVTVREEIDLEPFSVAGQDQVIQLPIDEVVLNGNGSYDDHGIVKWEWRKIEGPPADVSGSSGPVFKASKLQQGIYNFELTVYDAKEQSSKSRVTIHVLSEDNNKPPVADAGPHKELSLPDDSTSLDGRGSTDDVAVETYLWEMVKGPESEHLLIEDADRAVATVTGLVAGVYTFRLTVTDAQKESNSATTQVVVKEEVNMDPVANAGRDITISLPTDYVELDGSKSSDDKGITSYSWARDPKSPAAGVVLGNSQNAAILKVGQLVQGVYIFNLTVTDAKGKTSSDTARITVLEDPHAKDLVEVVFDENVSAFRENEKKELVVFLKFLVGNEVVLQEISHTTSGRLMVIFYATNSSNNAKSISGPSVIQMLKDKADQDTSLLKMNLISYNTVVCQKNCSNHGVCNQFSRQCVCETFWMQNFFRTYFGDGESNCDWSILYVIITAFFLTMLVGVLIWFLTCCFNRKRRKSKRKHQYSLLTEDLEGNDAIELLPKANGKQNSSIMVSASGEDTDDEITVYEHRKKRSRSEKKPLNGHIKRSKRYPGRTERL